jgi:Icc-related predicted phosphoesterase
MMICCISDFHGNLDFEVPDCDLVLIAGDICGSSQIKHQITYLSSKFKKFLEKLQDRGISVCSVGGNHDWVFQETPLLVPKLPWDYLEDSFSSFYLGSGKLLKIYGSPWQKRFHDWAFNLDPEDLKLKWSEIPEDTEVLLLHSPAYGILDLVLDGSHQGCPHLLERIRNLKDLKLVVYGHLHLQGGCTETHDFGNGPVKFVNAALMDDNYKLVRKPLIIEI